MKKVRDKVQKAWTDSNAGFAWLPLSVTAGVLWFMTDKGNDIVKWFSYMFGTIS